MPLTQKFPDTSHHKYPLVISGVPALITKGTEGAGFKDATYFPFKRQAADIAFAGFHWVNTEDLAAQVANAKSVIGQDPLMWDAEAPGATVPRLVELTHRAIDAGMNPTLVYLPRWWWRDHLGSPDLGPLQVLGLALVSSEYPAEGYTDDGPGWDMYGGMAPAIWQYTDAQLYNGKRVDFNAFKGTAAELAALIRGGTVPLTHEEAKQLEAALDRATAVMQNVASITTDWSDANPHGTEVNLTHAAIEELRSKIAALTVTGLNEDQVRAVVRDELARAHITPGATP